jgi:hypothetical protein
MSGLQPVSFRKGRQFEPRLSEKYVRGKHSERFWTEAEKEIIRRYYPEGGAPACLAHLPDHRTKSGVYIQAKKLGLHRRGHKRPAPAIVVTPELDQTIRDEWMMLDGRKKGEVQALADRLGVKRWWLSNRARTLGLTVAQKKQPPWTAAEDALMAKAPLHDPDRAAAMFREHGYSRSPSAIMVHAKRIGLSRRASREEFSAGGAAKILGIDAKGITRWCISGDLKAVKRDDRRRSQQGGSAWDIKPADLRRFILDNLEIIDLRKVEKVSFCLLIAGEMPGAAPDGTAKKRRGGHS